MTSPLGFTEMPPPPQTTSWMSRLNPFSKGAASTPVELQDTSSLEFHADNGIRRKHAGHHMGHHMGHHHGHHMGHHHGFHMSTSLRHRPTSSLEHEYVHGSRRGHHMHGFHHGRRHGPTFASSAMPSSVFMSPGQCLEGQTQVVKDGTATCVDTNGHTHAHHALKNLLRWHQ